MSTYDHVGLLCLIVVVGTLALATTGMLVGIAVMLQ